MAEASLPFSNQSNKICSIEGCCYAIRARRLCGSHYQRFWLSPTFERVTRRFTITRGARTEAPDEARAWNAMHQRCKNPSLRDYPRYGGRGIGVCDRWNSFDAFYADMGPRPSDKHSLDRIDNNKNYAPENCRWATPRDQVNNRQMTIFLTLHGRTQPLTVWAEEIGISASTLRHRRHRGWSDERALTEPVNK